MDNHSATWGTFPALAVSILALLMLCELNWFKISVWVRVRYDATSSDGVFFGGGKVISLPLCSSRQGCGCPVLTPRWALVRFCHVDSEGLHTVVTREAGASAALPATRSLLSSSGAWLDEFLGAFEGLKRLYVDKAGSEAAESISKEEAMEVIEGMTAHVQMPPVQVCHFLQERYTELECAQLLRSLLTELHQQHWMRRQIGAAFDVNYGP
eukprot:TRINITY_DN2651_c0_g1_i3.p1 TRINITY_DN2651_c0_g1~~TRINITY_DN2651_c0_g1_i3.p1  ORF type:complete len:211 (-),score=41.14 TRINITY_DN2651_c0_g1_i3:45-677(-)